MSTKQDPVHAEIVAINDEESTCSRCGRTGLKRVAWVSVDGAEPVPYGTTCVWRVLREVRHPATEQGRATWSRIEQVAREQAIARAVEILRSLPKSVISGPTENEWGVLEYHAKTGAHEGRGTTRHAAISDSQIVALRAHGFSHSVAAFALHAHGE